MYMNYFLMCSALQHRRPKYERLSLSKTLDSHFGHTQPYIIIFPFGFHFILYMALSNSFI